MLWAPSGAGTRVSAFLRVRKKQLLGSILLRRGRRWGFGSGIILKSWKICTGGMGIADCGFRIADLLVRATADPKSRLKVLSIRNPQSEIRNPTPHSPSAQARARTD